MGKKMRKLGCSRSHIALNHAHLRCCPNPRQQFCGALVHGHCAVGRRLLVERQVELRGGSCVKGVLVYGRCFHAWWCTVSVSLNSGLCLFRCLKQRPGDMLGFLASRSPNMPLQVCSSLALNAFPRRMYSFSCIGERVAVHPARYRRCFAEQARYSRGEAKRPNCANAVPSKAAMAVHFVQ